MTKTENHYALAVMVFLVVLITDGDPEAHRVRELDIDSVSKWQSQSVKSGLLFLSPHSSLNQVCHAVWRNEKMLTKCHCSPSAQRWGGPG